VDRFFYLMIISVFAAGCSSSPNIATNVKTVEVNLNTNKTVAVAVNQPQSISENESNANKIVIQNPLVSKENARIWEKKKGRDNETTSIADKVSKYTVPAPDNSEITNEMNEKGQPLETRTFKKHQILTKIERIDLDNQNVRVYLRNGRVVNLPEGKIENFLTAPASDILNALSIGGN